MFQLSKIFGPTMLVGVFVAAGVSGAGAALLTVNKPTAGVGDGAASTIRVAQQQRRMPMVRRGTGRVRSRSTARVPRVHSKPRVRRTRPSFDRSVKVRRRPVVRSRDFMKSRRKVKRPYVMKRRIKKPRKHRIKRRRPGIQLYMYDYPRYNYRPGYYAKLSCTRVKHIIEDRGYRRVRAYDCKGKVYGFYVKLGKKRYILKVSAYTGRTISRSRR